MSSFVRKSYIPTLCHYALSSSALACALLTEDARVWRAPPGVLLQPSLPEGTKRATSVNVQLPCLRKDLRTGSISRDTEFPLRSLQAQKWHVHRTRTFGAAWFLGDALDRRPRVPSRSLPPLAFRVTAFANTFLRTFGILVRGPR